MNFFWTLVPFSNRQMLYPIGGKGTRPRIGLRPYFAGVLDQLWVIEIGGVKLPLGLFFVLWIVCNHHYMYFEISLWKRFNSHR